MKKVQTEDFAYYSKVLKRVFNSLEELREAEEAYLKEQTQKEELVKQKAERAKEVENAFKQARDAQEKADELTAKARKTLNEFVKDFGSYHYSFREEKKVDNEQNKVKQPTRNLFDIFFENFFF